MRILYLLRHAKSSRKDESIADFERPLAGRGRKACVLIARLIQEKEIQFDLILSSSAVRARETIELISQHAKLRCELRFDERIYEASANRLLEIVSEIHSDRKTVLVVGHNPGLEDLLQLLTRENLTLPTASLAKVKLKISKWSESAVNKGSLDWMERPKELDGG